MMENHKHIPRVVQLQGRHHEQHLIRNDFLSHDHTKRKKCSLHMSAVAPWLSIPSTETVSALSSRRSWTASGLFSHAAMPNGITPFIGLWGAFSVNREISGWRSMVLMVLRRFGVMKDASDASTSCQLSQGPTSAPYLGW